MPPQASATLFGLGVLLATDEFPYAPLLAFFLVSPAYWWAVSLFLYNVLHMRIPAPTFLRALCAALLLLSSAAGALCIVWVLTNNNWDGEPHSSHYYLITRLPDYNTWDGEPPPTAPLPRARTSDQEH